MVLIRADPPQARTAHHSDGLAAFSLPEPGGEPDGEPDDDLAGDEGLGLDLGECQAGY
jgi:hypothetical protein